MSPNTVYLDNNATTPVLPEAVEAMVPYWTATPGNPASVHAEGARARRALEDARECVASTLGAQPDEIVFTSGGTEANNLALFGLTAGRSGHLAVSRIEHPSVAECAEALEQRGWDVSRFSVDREGIVDREDLARQMRPDTWLVTVMLANNETGAIQPVAELAALAMRTGAAFHTDAVQAIGKMPVRFSDLGVTTLSLSGHKVQGPKGIGALVVRRGTQLAPLLHGGHQQAGLRPGTEPVALAVGLAKALEIAVSQLDKRCEYLRGLRDALHDAIRQAVPDVVLNGPRAARLPNTLNLSFPGIEAQAMLINLDLAGVCCSAGSACSSGSLEPSPTLVAMGCPDAVLHSAIRFSVGIQNTHDEIQSVAARVAAVVKRLRALQPT